MLTLKNCDHHGMVSSFIKPKDMHVLIVDDGEIAAEHARVVLDEADIPSDTCFSGEEALHVGVDSFLAKPLFASNVIDKFERIAKKNNLSLFREKRRAELKGRRILMAEDIIINAEIIRQIMTARGAEIDHAANGKIALEKFDSSAPGYYDAILMDVRMPEMDGLEATAAIRAMNRKDAKTIPIIAMTANAFDEDVQQSLQAGMNAHLSKPVEPEYLYQTLAELIWEADQETKEA